VAYDDEQFYTLNTIYNLIGVSDYSLKYLLGIINSKIGKYFWIAKNSDFKVLFPKIKKSQIEVIPIRTINFSDDAEKALHERLVGLVEKMLALTPKFRGATSESEKAVLHNAVTTTDAEIDRLVYELYGLTAEEIKIVEGEC
jgi:adenine-specific DNA-methyltransferase